MRDVIDSENELVQECAPAAPAIPRLATNRLGRRARAHTHTHTHTIKTPKYQSRSRFQKGEDFCAVQKIRLYQKLNGDNVDHRFLAVQTFKPREFERFGRSEE